MIKFIDYPSYLQINSKQDRKTLDKIVEDMKEISKEYNIQIVMRKINGENFK